MSQHHDFERALLDDPSREALLVWSDLLEESGIDGAGVRMFARYRHTPFVVDATNRPFVCWVYGWSNPSMNYNLPTALFNTMAGRTASKRVVWGVEFVVHRRDRRSAAAYAAGKAIFRCEPDTIAHAHAAAIYAAAQAMLRMEQRAAERRSKNAELLEAV